MWTFLKYDKDGWTRRITAVGIKIYFAVGFVGEQFASWNFVMFPLAIGSVIFETVVSGGGFTIDRVEWNIMFYRPIRVAIIKSQSHDSNPGRWI